MENQIDSKSLSSEEEIAVRQFLIGRRILIADNSTVARQSLANVFVELGANHKDVHTVRTYAEALSAIQEYKPNILISDYNLSDDHGIQLIEPMKEQLSDPQDKLFIISTTNGEQSAVAEAAEEDVDSYILKPFSANIFKVYISRVVANKLSPSQYMAEIKKGQKALMEDSYQDAYIFFHEAKSLHKAPALAHYYAAKSLIGLNRYDEALYECQAGLELVPNHYKCLSLKFDILYSSKNYKEAYSTAQRLVGQFPIGSTRLGDIFTLAVLTHNFGDVEKYYLFYKKLDRRPDELRKVVAAGLLVCGKSMLKQGLEKRAVNLFRQALSTSHYEFQYFEKIVQSLLAKKMTKEALSVLDIFPKDMRSDAVFLQLEFRLLNVLETPERIIERGREIIKKRMADEHIFEDVIRRLISLEKFKAAEITLDEAISQFPDKRTYFNELHEEALGKAA